ncbi:MAG: T9SS type A sorting domain-containing protein, partial [Bacteroidota bacterium]
GDFGTTIVAFDNLGLIPTDPTVGNALENFNNIDLNTSTAKSGNATVSLSNGRLVFEGDNSTGGNTSQVTVNVEDTSLDEVDALTLFARFLNGSDENVSIELLDGSSTTLASFGPTSTQNFSPGTITIDLSSVTGTLDSVRFIYNGNENGTTSMSFDNIALIASEPLVGNLLEDFNGFADNTALDAALSNKTNATVTLSTGRLIFEGDNGASGNFSQFTLDVTDTSLDGIQNFTVFARFVNGSNENLFIELLDPSGSTIASLDPVVGTQSLAGTLIIDVGSVTATLASVRFSYQGVDAGVTTVSFDNLGLAPSSVAIGTILEDFSSYTDNTALSAVISSPTNATTTLSSGAMIFEGNNGTTPFFSQITLDVTDTSLGGFDAFRVDANFVTGSNENLFIELLDETNTTIASLDPVIGTQSIANTTITIDVSNVAANLSAVRFSYQSSDFGVTSVSFDNLELVPTAFDEQSAPTGLVITQLGETSFTVGWDAPAGSNGANVFISTTGGEDVLASTLAAGVNSFKYEGTYGDITINPGEEYVAKVQLLPDDNSDAFAQLTVETDPVVLSVNERGSNLALTVLPNPVVNELRIINESNVNLEQATLLTSAGKVLKHYQISGKGDVLSVQNLPNGLYFLSVRDENDQVVTVKRFIKN